MFDSQKKELKQLNETPSYYLYKFSDSAGFSIVKKHWDLTGVNNEPYSYAKVLWSTTLGYPVNNEISLTKKLENISFSSASTYGFDESFIQNELFGETLNDLIEFGSDLRPEIFV